jgi:hypothetical protein
MKSSRPLGLNVLGSIPLLRNGMLRNVSFKSRGCSTSISGRRCPCEECLCTWAVNARAWRTDPASGSSHFPPVKAPMLVRRDTAIAIIFCLHTRGVDRCSLSTRSLLQSLHAIRHVTSGTTCRVSLRKNGSPQEGLGDVAGGAASIIPVLPSYSARLRGLLAGAFSTKCCCEWHLCASSATTRTA